MFAHPLPSSSPDLYFGKYAAGLFARGEQGAWYDPSDLGTLFQDAAGTMPVTGVGQPVGRILDKSGRGNHATQSTATSRPSLQQENGGRYYLSFDGVDDWLVTLSVDFTATDKITAFAGVRKLSDATRGIIVEQQNLGLGGGNTVFALSGPQANGASNYAAFTVAVASATVAAPSTNLLTGLYAPKELVAQAALKVNAGAIIVADTAPFATITANQPITIGRRGSGAHPFNGRLYGLIVRGTQTDNLHLTNVERFLAHKSGVVL